MRKYSLILIAVLLLLMSCSSTENQNENTQIQNQNTELITIESNLNTIDKLESTESNQISDDIVKNNHNNKDTLNEEQIELRGNSIWISIEDLNDISLDGEEYSVNKDILKTASNSYVNISFPLIIIDGERVYNLETYNMVLDLTEILKQLDIVWGIEVAEEEYVWYSDVLLTSNDFSYIDNVVYFNHLDLIAVSMHSFYADVLDSIVMSYDVSKNEIKFIQNPFYGQVNHIEYSGEAEYLSYAYYTIGDKVISYVDIVDGNSLELISRIEIIEVVTEMYDNINYDGLEVRITQLYWDDNKLNAILNIQDLENSDFDKAEVEVILWNKE